MYFYHVKVCDSIQQMWNETEEAASAQFCPPQWVSYWVREALKKCKTFYNQGGGWSGQRNFTFQKVVLKMHFRLFWTILVIQFFWLKRGGGPILSYFTMIFGFCNFFYKCLTFLGGKKHFFVKKCSNNGLRLILKISTKTKSKYHVFFIYSKHQSQNWS